MKPVLALTRVTHCRVLCLLIKIRNAERPGMIGVTQPRRVAAVSMATRVAEELNSAIGSLVAYQV